MSGPLLYLAESALGLAAFYAVYWLALRNDTHFQASRVYLLGSLLAAHLFPLVPVTSPFRRRVILPVGDAGVLDPGPASASAGWPETLLLWVYLAGAALVLARLAWHLRVLAVGVGGRPALVRDGIRLVFVDEDYPPFSFFRTAFVHRSAEGDRAALDQVLAHEGTHIRQGHWLDLILVHAVSSIQWFNPFAWLYKDALGDLHELLADRAVLDRGFDPANYGHLLLEQHLDARSFELVHHLRESRIKRRLAMMTRRSGRWTLCKHFLGLPALCLLVLVFARPDVVIGSEAGALDQATTGVSAPQAARPGQTVKPAPVADETKEVDRKKLDAEFKKKMVSLKEEYLAATDPELKQALSDKMNKLEQHHAQEVATLELNDAKAVEEMLAKLSQKLAALQAKEREGLDAETTMKVQQELENLTRKLEFLKARLAELKAVR